jgi:hypothetical protein
MEILPKRGGAKALSRRFFKLFRHLPRPRFGAKKNRAPGRDAVLCLFLWQHCTIHV